MPIAALIGLDGAVTTTQQGGTITGWMDDLAATPPTLLGTVSTALVAAYEGANAGPVWWRVRVKIGDEWVGEDELADSVTITRDRDATIATFRFSVRGPRWTVFATEHTWTKVVPVEVHYWTGADPTSLVGGRVVRGYVTRASQSDEHGAVIQIECGDVGAKFALTEVCYELAPFSGLSRGQIVAQVCALAGISYDLPAGSRYDKPVQLANVRVLEWIRDFVEPEGWVPHFDDTGTLTVSVPTLSESPDPADHEWGPSDWSDIEISPPADVPSRWVIRGTSAVLQDELGITTRVTRSEIRAFYARVACPESQANGTGTITSTGLTTPAETYQLVSLVIDELQQRGGKDISQRTREWGYYNPRAAYLARTNSMQTDVEPIFAWIDPEGEYRQWPTEKWTLLGERLQTFAYDEEGTRTGHDIKTHRYYTRTRGVRTVDSVDANVLNVWVYGDDESYSERYETFGLADQQTVAIEYDEATGAEARQIQTTRSHYAPKSAVEGPGIPISWYVVFNGTGQTELTANWRVVQEKVITNIVSDDGLILGKREVTFGYTAPKKVDGINNWGEFNSNAEEEQYRAIEARNIEYHVENDEQVTAVSYDKGERTETTVLGGLPTPRYLGSAWTRIALEQLEVVIDDPVIEAWFGFQRQVLTNEYVQSLDEARRMLERRIRRALSREHTISRPLALAAMHDTVTLTDPDQGVLGARALVVAVEQTLPVATGYPQATYHLEEPLL